MSSIHLRPHGDGGIPAPRLTEVSPGVYAYIQLDGSWFLNNTGFLIRRGGVTVVDTCGTEPRARAFREELRGVTDRPIRTLIDTHHHGDHTWGNFVFPEATIIGHTLCRREMIETGLSIQPLFPGVDWGSLEVEPPFVTFDDRLTVHVDDLRLELIFLGPAHTTNDVIVWVPERRILFSGDLIFSGCTPFVVQGSLAGHLRALEALRDLGAETIVPGHGEICGPAVIDDAVAYLHFVQDLAGRAFAAGVSPLEAARQADLGRFGEWHETERLVANLHRAFSELRGEPLGAALPLAAIVPEMVELNGGPLRCLA